MSPGASGMLARTVRREKDPTVSDHKGEEMKGRTKEAAGAVTGDDDLKREGKVDQASASVKDKISDATDSIKEAVNPSDNNR